MKKLAPLNVHVRLAAATSFASALLASASALAQSPALPAGIVDGEPDGTESSHRSGLRLGVLIDAGLPDGLGVALALEPAYWVSLEVGMSFNFMAPCASAGLRLAPTDLWISPLVTLEGGRCFEGNANEVARILTGDGGFSAEKLERLGYDYFSAQIGLELRTEDAAIRLVGGVSDLHLRRKGEPMPPTETIPAYGAIPTASIGVLAYL